MFHALIADNKVVRLFEMNDDGAVQEFATFNNIDAMAHDRDLVSDRPGRAVNPGAGLRQAYEPRTSAKSLALQRWLKFIAAQLPTLLANRASDGLVLVGAPRLLTQLRSELPPNMRALVCAELRRDLAKHSTAVLGRRMLTLMSAVLRERRAAALLGRPTRKITAPAANVHGAL